MEKTHVQHELVEGKQSQEGGARRRVAEKPYVFSQADFTRPEVRRSLAEGARVLLSFRRLPSEQE
jgi:hypothetical protein